MIDPNEYIFIADHIDDAQSQGRGVADGITNMSIYLNSNEIPDGDYNKIRLNSIIESTYLIIVQEYLGLSKEVLDFVLALQNHVSHHYGSVNSMLSSNGLKVGPYFASISLAVGYEIESSLIR